MVLDDVNLEWRIRKSKKRKTQREASGPRGYVELGERGHDYVRSHDDASLGTLSEASVAEVDILLASRLQLQFARDFRGADMVQGELLHRLGVKVEDTLREWRADGSSWRLADQKPRDPDRGVGDRGVGGQQQERRLDGSQGAFTKQEFFDYYGSYEQWDDASVAPQ